ncbi:MAG: hypothetical protein KDK55_03555 [Chlamydiia bacterium]|nr:hypothetical protein [Chlamydiia bacterium]
MNVKKLLKDLSLFFPFRQRRIFFIYTHNNVNHRFFNGLTANTEISYWTQTGLQSAFSHVQFLRLQGEKQFRINQITPKDVVIGHPGETYRKAALRTKRLIAFYPWCGHEDRVRTHQPNCSNLEQELNDLKNAQSIVFLTSEYNVKTYIQTPTNFWHDICQKKSVKWVFQPIDLTQFSRIKTSYTTNDFLYIGNNNHMKCLDASISLVKEVGKKLTIYGIKKKIDNRKTQTVSQLAEKADFFIQPGMWEGQCVSILEAAARGFIPLVSKETGYPYDHPYLLRYNDYPHNLSILKNVLKTSPQERKELGDDLHHRLKNDPNHNDWNQLVNVLVEEVRNVF